MKLLVLGRLGQVSSHLRQLAPNALFWGRRELDLRESPTRIQARIVEESPDAIINTAAYTAVAKAEEERDSAWALNSLAPAAIARAARDIGAPLIHFSTDYVFDGKHSAPYAPTDPVSPLGIYGASKLGGELAVRVLYQRSWILRCSWVFSEHGGNFVKTMLHLGAGREEIRVVADQFGRPSYAGDLACLSLRLAQAAVNDSLKSRPGIYHLGSGPVVSWHDFAARIFDRAAAGGLVNRQPKLVAISSEEYQDGVRRPPRAVLAPSVAFQEELGGIPDWQIGLEHTLSKLTGC